MSASGQRRRLSRPVRAGPPIPLSARAVLTVDLARAARQLGAAQRRPRAAPNAPASSRPTPTASGSAPIARALTNEGCKTFFVATHRRGPRPRAQVQPGATIYVLDGLLPGAEAALRRLRSAPRALEPRRGARLGRLLPRARTPPAGRHPHRHRHEPARHARRRGRAAGGRAATCSPPSRSTLVMSHLACADEPANPMNERQRERFDGAARQAAAGAGEPLQLRRHVPGPALSTSTWCGRASRSTAAARTRAGRTRCSTVVRLAARILQVRDVGARRDHRLRRHLQGASALAHRHHRLRLCRRLPARLERADRRGRPGRLHRRLSGADRRARVDGLHHRRRHRRARRSWRGAAPGSR